MKFGQNLLLFLRQIHSSSNTETRELVMVGKIDTNHHIKAISPALEAMQTMGFKPADCLRHTGLTEADLRKPSAEVGFTLEQEFQFHRNLLALTDNPMLGLLLGKAYQLEAYGLLG